MTHPQIAPVTYDNAKPRCWMLNLTRFRLPTQGRAGIFESNNASDNYVSIALIEAAFSPWTFDIEGSENKMIHITPADAEAALARFDAFEEISPEAFPRSYQIDRIREALIASINEGVTIIFSVDC